MTRRPPYPFRPKSTSYLAPGQFWAIPLRDGRFACGRVLAVLDDPADAILGADTRMFLAGLMDWVGGERPTSGDLAGAQVVAQGKAHVRTIQVTGGEILGERSLELDGVTGLREISHRAGGTVYLYEGARRVRPATDEEAERLPTLSTWGYDVIRILAEKQFSPLDGVSGRRR